MELYDFYGKVIVVDFSTMWCAVCVNIATEGDQLVAKYGEENVVWLTVLIENEFGNPPDVTDLQRWVANTGYPITGWPTLVVIDRNMVLKHGISGWSEQAIDIWVSGLL